MYKKNAYITKPKNKQDQHRLASNAFGWQEDKSVLPNKCLFRKCQSHRQSKVTQHVAHKENAGKSGRMACSSTDDYWRMECYGGRNPTSDGTLLTTQSGNRIPQSSASQNQGVSSRNHGKPWSRYKPKCKI